MLGEYPAQECASLDEVSLTNSCVEFGIVALGITRLLSGVEFASAREVHTVHSLCE
jgi:hypothetical protein